MEHPVKKLTLSDLNHLLSPRPRSAHKGDFGHVLVIGGDYGMAGAVRMCGEAAARVGAGLTTVATRAPHINIVSAVRPELMCYGVHDATILEKLLQRVTVIALGPGLGQSDWSQQLFATALAVSQPKVIDADGLNLLSQQPHKNDQWILTPHVGEAARLLNCSTADIQNDRLQAALKLQQMYGGIIVLKGHGTLIVGPDQTLSICNAGNPGMATGGMGDVLTGVIAGLVAQQIDLLSAAKLGVCLHAAAGDLAAKEGERGTLALDLMPYLRQLVNPAC